ncbi:uncharacterized protein LOC114327646 [Diabrotica virgifera virgifera]|uniref:TTF-type domain-containing protein n=1 Tax=Diabrotica virgifera virgifera TaxID=50390 RepID=A0ABM5JRZ3_DIAVI|nr:uncharacterized protein LOC114327646 [Diabrotica virgifera virgifera]
MPPKRKGGQEKKLEREKKKRCEIAKKCHSLDNLLNSYSVPSTSGVESDINTEKQEQEQKSEENLPVSETKFETELKLSEDSDDDIETSDESDSEANVKKALKDEEALLKLGQPEETESGNFFDRPDPNKLQLFFEFHPKVPVAQKDVPFNVEKAFTRNNKTKRKWLSYSEERKALFCTICLAYSVESNKDQSSAFVRGMSDWKHVYQRINEHESSISHGKNCETYFMYIKNQTIEKILFGNVVEMRNKKVASNRHVLDVIIDVIKLIGKRGLSYRGTANEAAYNLENENLDHGNFLEIILLLSKFDVILKKHLDAIVKKSKSYHNRKIKRRAGNFYTFLSKTTVNSIIVIITEIILKKISSEIQTATMFSIEIDSTQDISVTDQCSFVTRYVYNGTIHERLLAVVPCHNSTGKGFHTMIHDILVKNGLDEKNCIADSTDGAANMQGRYSGFSSFMVQENSNHVHVWCYAHILNLVLTDIFKSHIKAASFFSLLNCIAAFFKESHQRMGYWLDIGNNARSQKLQLIGETRWWSKEAALSKIFGNFNEPNKALYVDLIDILNTIENSQKIKPDARATAANYKAQLLKYENILIGHIFLKLFSITGPLSRYIQTTGLDLLKCNFMVNDSILSLKKMQRNFPDIEASADKFVGWAKLSFERRDFEIFIEEQLPEFRSKKKKKFFDEKTSDEIPVSPKENFRIVFFNVIADTAVESISRRFANNAELCRDLNILDPNNFEEIAKGELPENSLKILSEKLIQFDSSATPAKLKEELASFASNWKHIKLTIEDSYEINYARLDVGLDDSSSAQSDVDEDDCITKQSTKSRVCIESNKCQNCVICCYGSILKYNLFKGAYSTLVLAYQYILSLPISQVACERSFSTLKLIKNRLRNSLSDNRLESFMLMNIENDILSDINNDEIINRLGQTTKLMKDALMY